MEEYVSLNQNRDFQRIYAKGKSFVSSGLVSYVLKNRKGTVRFGITTSRKTGNAVRRNRSRRVIRAAFRAVSGGVSPGYDLVFVARGRTSYLKSTEVRRLMARHLKNAGVLKK